MPSNICASMLRVSAESWSGIRSTTDSSSPNRGSATVSSDAARGEAGETEAAGNLNEIFVSGTEFFVQP